MPFVVDAFCCRIFFKPLLDLWEARPRPPLPLRRHPPAGRSPRPHPRSHAPRWPGTFPKAQPPPPPVGGMVGICIKDGWRVGKGEEGVAKKGEERRAPPLGVGGDTPNAQAPREEGGLELSHVTFFSVSRVAHTPRGGVPRAVTCHQRGACAREGRAIRLYRFPCRQRKSTPYHQPEIWPSLNLALRPTFFCPSLHWEFAPLPFMGCLNIPKHGFYVGVFTPTRVGKEAPG